MKNITHYVCGVIPPHMLSGVAERANDTRGNDARATIEHMREVATGCARTFIAAPAAVAPKTASRNKRRRVYDAQNKYRLPGRLARSEHKPRSRDVEVNEAYDGSGATYDFFARLFGRNSIDGRGMHLDSTVHYGVGFENAMWNGQQIVYGEGDGRIFDRFTASLDVIAHELTHGITQYSAALGYSGQTGALNEHLSDAFGIMVKQYTLGESAEESDWLIGSELFGSEVNGIAIRSMAAPGTAYDDAILGRDPQPSHMRDYVDTDEDNGGVHINSGIPNHAFFLAARAIGGKTWQVLGRIWYVAMTTRLQADDDFNAFAGATVDVAGDLFGRGGLVQRAIGKAWRDVGLVVRPSDCGGSQVPLHKRRDNVVAIARNSDWRQRAA